MPIATVPGAIVGSSILGAGASLLGANSAARASQRATDQAVELQRQQYDQMRADLAPYVQAGYGALDDYRAQVADLPAWSFGPQDYVESPGFNYLLDRTLDQVQARGAAGGYRLSSAMMRQLADATRGLLSQDYYQQQALSRANYESDRNYRAGGLYNLAGLGQNAAAQVGNAGQGYASGVSNALLNNAATQGAAAQNAAGAVNNLIGQGLNAYVSYKTSPAGATAVLPSAGATLYSPPDRPPVPADPWLQDNPVANRNPAGRRYA